MGSFDATCEMCDEKKSIRVECNCGICICEDCRNDSWDDSNHMCIRCSRSIEEKKEENDKKREKTE